MEKIRKPERLTDRFLKDALKAQPLISTFDELCAVKDVDIDEVELNDKKRAEKQINANNCKMKVMIKEELLKMKTRQAYELLYKLIGNEKDLKRLGVKTSEDGKISVQPVIEIRSADDKIIDKLREL